MTRTTDQWEALLEGISEAPWIAEYSGEQGDCVIPHDAQSTREAVATCRLLSSSADAELIAAAPEAVAELIRLRRKLEERVRVWEQVAGMLEAARHMSSVGVMRDHIDQITHILNPTEGNTND